ncbi:MAG: serine hydrolase domain-containing protein [Planctomycetota bacterium]
MNRSRRTLCRSSVILCVSASLLAILSAATNDAASKQKSPEDVAPLLKDLVAKHKVPGLVALVLKNNDVVGLGAAGVRAVGHDAPITVTDKFHLGSCTKAMTATLCARLVERDKLKWNSTLADVFPDFRDSMHADFRGVTLEQLLSHRSGLPGHANRDDLWSRLWAHKGSTREGRRLALESLLKHPPESAPGTQFIYSNMGYMLAGHMAEQVTDKSWEELMRELIFKPLKMASADFGAPGTAGKFDEPCGHKTDGKCVEPGPAADNPPSLGPAGTVHARMEDWARFVALHLRGARGDAPPLLRTETFARLHAPLGADKNYALGWSTTEREWAQGPVLTHSGSNTMWFCVVWIAPKRDFAVLIACNQGGGSAERACDDAAGALIARFLTEKK